MPREQITRVIQQMQARIHAVHGRGEEATKQSLVLPMLDALGYDIWNPGEVCPEFDADFAIRKGAQKERVDLAVMIDGEPRIFIEVKSVDVALDSHSGQLSRYFNAVPSVSLGILTNGVEWRFFTDTGEPNLMDSRAFHVVRVDAVDQGIEVLSRFHKSAFSPEGIRDYATELEYTAKFVSFLKAQIDLRKGEPSEEFVRWVLGSDGMYDGRVVASVVNRFTPIVRNSLSIMLKDVVRRSLVALDQVVAEDEQESDDRVGGAEETGTVAAENEHVEEPVTGKRKARDRAIVTTEAELTAYSIIEGMFHKWQTPGGTIFDRSKRQDVPIEIGYKDTTGYFGVYFNKSSWWFARLALESKRKWVGFSCDEATFEAAAPPGVERLDAHPFAAVRVEINGMDDIVRLEPLFVAAMEAVVRSKAV